MNTAGICLTRCYDTTVKTDTPRRYPSKLSTVVSVPLLKLYCWVSPMLLHLWLNSISSTALGSNSPSFTCSFPVANWSPLVGPTFNMNMGFPCSEAAFTKRKADHTSRDVPTTNIESELLTWSNTKSTLSFGTFSPNITTPGLRIPLHSTQLGTTKVEKSSPLNSKSPSGLKTLNWSSVNDTYSHGLKNPCG